MNERLNVMVQIEPYIGTYYSRDYVKRKILRQTDEEIIEMESEMDKENEAGVGVPLETQNMIMQGQMEADPGMAPNLPQSKTTAMGQTPKNPEVSKAKTGLDIKKAKI